ncbi:MAG: beta-propeller domain-containing protein [Myxococcales bacterium]|nr:beta-propeller domain-containing protein [Myxococcales bacterium]
MSHPNRFPLWLILYLLAACPGATDSQIAESLKAVTSDQLERFGSPEEFDAYVNEVRSIRDQRSGWGGPFGCGASSREAAESAPQNAGQADESITNNQESGVDEGDIVKAAGDYFIILRRGRLFTVRLRDAGQPALAPISKVDAFPAGYTQGTWYDEILVYADRVVVIGFSYRLSATEIGLFRLSPEGRLSHEAHYFLRSNDYYSSRNYASRLVGGKLVFYMPHYMFAYDRQGGGVTLPAMRSWVKGDDVTPWKDILSKVEVYKPVQPSSYPTLHTVVQCDLTAETTECTARAVIGPYARTFYVSRDAVYLWVSPGWEVREGRLESFVYRLPLLEGEVTALRARGGPIDQFSFREEQDGQLDVLLLAESGGDAMWHPEIATGDLMLLRAPASAFSGTPAPVGAERFTRLQGPKSWSMQNRFVGEHLLYGTGGGWVSRNETDRRVFVLEIAQPEKVRELPLEHGVDRIEVMGSGAAVVGSDGTNLHFSAVALGDVPEVRSTHVRPDSAQGETRSHGFFFKPDALGGGVLGLPIRLDGDAWRHLLYGSAEVVFLRVDSELRFTPMGSLAASEESADDQCKVSCVDWYGNARPIFYRGRMFALLGYELVEGVVGETAVSESGRVSYLLAGQSL